ncbi:MAG: segregation and condensation protein A [Lachnospiraceae bacterium]|jgi:segregation and condensation protein A
MAIPVKLEVFEGPLDLLLHLIEREKINIYDIPIFEITNQYLEYIESLQHEDMNIASEFMVMAAELIDIKCRMLLPSDPDSKDEEDPREELVKRLLEYKMYKVMSDELREKMDGENTVFRHEQMPEEVLSYRPPVSADELLDNVTLSKLSEIFNDLLKRQAEKIDPVRSEFKEVYSEPVSIEKRIEELARYASKHKRFFFSRLLKEQRSRQGIIVTFLAVLEFIKSGLVTVSQESPFDDIEIVTVEGSDFSNIEIEGNFEDEF